MQYKNRYYRGAHMSEQQLRQLLHYFIVDLSAADVAQLTGITRKTVTTIFLKFRRRISELVMESPEIAIVARTELSRMKNFPMRELLNEEESNFHDYTLRRLQKFKGVSEHTLTLHLQECAWRYVHRDRDLYRELLKSFRLKPL